MSAVNFKDPKKEGGRRQRRIYVMSIQYITINQCFKMTILTSISVSPIKLFTVIIQTVFKR